MKNGEMSSQEPEKIESEEEIKSPELVAEEIKLGENSQELFEKTDQFKQLLAENPEKNWSSAVKDKFKKVGDFIVDHHDECCAASAIASGGLGALITGNYGALELAVGGTAAWFGLKKYLGNKASKTKSKKNSYE